MSLVTDDSQDGDAPAKLPVGWAQSSKYPPGYEPRRVPPWVKKRALVSVVTAAIVYAALFVFGWLGAVVALIVFVIPSRWIAKKVAPAPP